MKISTETYQYQSYSGQYERFAPGYAQPDYVLFIDAIISYCFSIGALKKHAWNLLIVGYPR